MQNSEKIKDRESKHGEDTFFGRIVRSLKEKDELQVRRRLAALVDFVISFLITYFLGGVKLFFGTYPLCIALMCSTRRRLAPIALAAAILAVSGSLPLIYTFACVAVILIRILAMLLPMVLNDGMWGRERREVIVRPKADVVNVQRKHTESCVRSERVGTARTHENRDGKRFVGTNGDSDAVSKDDTASNQSDDTDEDKCRSGIDGLFCEELHIKAICGAIGGFLCGVFLLIQHDFSFYSLCATLILTFGCPVAVAILGGYFGEERYKKKWYVFLSTAFISLVAVYAASGRSIIGMPMAPFLAMLLTLYVTKDRGVLCGILVGGLCGLAFNTVYIPMLILSALSLGFVSAVKRNAGLAVVCAISVVWCYYIGGATGLVEVLPPVLLAIPVYMIVDKYIEMMFAPYNREAVLTGGIYFAQAVTEKNKNVAVRERLGALSEAFSSLSETFYKLSDRFRRPDALGLGKLSENAFEKRCDGCRNREVCWGAEYADTLDAIKCVASALHTKGTAECSDLPKGFVARCLRCDKIIEDVNSIVASTTEDMIRGDKVGFFASSYDDITEILKDALNCDDDEYKCDIEAAEKIFDYLYSEGFRLGGVVVYGQRSRHVLVKGVSISDKMSVQRQNEICKKISEMIGAQLTPPTFELSDDGAIMHLRSKPRFKAKCAHGRLAAPNDQAHDGDRLIFDGLYVDPFKEDDGELCGDVTNCFITESSYFYSLISDGMGSGADAAFTAGVCSMFIEKMLAAGNRSDITLRMLNNIIRSENMGCGREVSATVDLFELDLIRGTASFIKSGAAPTYIARGETVYKIYSRTMPVGIIKDADTKITRFDTQKGDIIIMMSDGCCPDSEDCPWLVEFLCRYTAERKRSQRIGEDECEQLKDTLIKLAAKNYPSEKDRDDLSVSVVFIE